MKPSIHPAQQSRQPLPAYGRREVMLTLLGVVLLLAIGLSGNFQQKLDRTKPREPHPETGEVCAITVGGGRTVFATPEEARRYHLGGYTVVALWSAAFSGAFGSWALHRIRKGTTPVNGPAIAPRGAAR